MVLAGGTDLMVEFNSGHRRPQAVMRGRSNPASCARGRTIPDRRHAADRCGGHLRRAGGRTLPAVGTGARQAARTVGSPQIRHAATHRRQRRAPARRRATACRCCLRSTPWSISCRPRARVRSPFGEFMTGPKRTALLPGELIESVSRFRCSAAGRATRRSECATRWSFAMRARALSSMTSAAYASLSVRSGRRSSAATTPRRSPRQLSTASTQSVDRRRCRRVRTPGGVGVSADRRSSVHSRVSPARDRGVGRAGCCGGRSRMA